MPQGSGASPGWFVKVADDVVHGMEQMAAYLDDVVVFDSEPAAYTRMIRAFFERLRKHNLKRSTRKTYESNPKPDANKHKRT